MIGVVNYLILLFYFLNIQCREDYKRSFLAQLSSPNSSASLSSYLDAHNAYVTQLHATNGMVDQYNQYVLPQLLQVTSGPDHVGTIFLRSSLIIAQELEDVYTDLCLSLSDAVLQGSEIIYNKVNTIRILHAPLISVHLLTVSFVCLIVKRSVKEV